MAQRGSGPGRVGRLEQGLLPTERRPRREPGAAFCVSNVELVVVGGVGGGYLPINTKDTDCLVKN